MAQDPGIRLSTAPSVVPFEEMDLETTAELALADAQDLDEQVELYRGNVETVPRAMKRAFEIRMPAVAASDLEKLDRWRHDRIRVRINGNYGARTVFYQCFQRRNPYDGARIAPQIGAATFARATTPGKALELSPTGVLNEVADAQPRFAAGPWGMRGILLEAGANNYILTSHPASGSLLWAAFAGAPSLTWTTEVAEHVLGAGGALRVVLGASESVYLVGAVSGTRMSAGLWYRAASGPSCTFEARDFTSGTLLASASMTTGTTEGDWRHVRLDYINVSGVATVRLVVKASASGAIVYLGNANLHNSDVLLTHMRATGGTGATKPLDSLLLTGLRGLTAACTIQLGLIMPSNTIGTQRKWLAYNASGLEWYVDPTNQHVYFQKKAVSNKAEYTTTKLTIPGVVASEAVLAGTWGLTDIALYEDGVLKNSATYTANHTQGDSLYIGGETVGNRGADTAIAWIRVDAERLSAAAIAEVAGRYTDPIRRSWTIWSEGRDFIIERLSGRIQVGPDTFEVTARIREMRAFDEALTTKR